MYPGRCSVSGHRPTLIALAASKSAVGRTKICRCGERRGSRLRAYNYDMPLAATRTAIACALAVLLGPGSPARRAACSGWRCRPCPPPWIPRSPRTRPPGCWRGRSSTLCCSTARDRATSSPGSPRSGRCRATASRGRSVCGTACASTTGPPCPPPGGGQPRARALPGRGRRARRQSRGAARSCGAPPGVVKAVRVPDPRTVQIVLALPYAPLLSVLAHPALAIVRLSTGPTAPRDGSGPARSSSPRACRAG